MKPLSAVVVGLVLVAGAGTWWATRHRPSGSLLDDAAPPFRVERAEPGWCVRFVDQGMPLRALRWIQPRQEGILAAQVLTQNDRQMVTLVRGAAATDIAVARPQGVGEGFWRLAQLQEVLLAPDGAVLLLYRPGEAGSSELSLAMALDPGALEARWVHRGAYEHLALGGDTDAGVFLYGAAGPVLHLPLAGPSRHPVARSIELPPEVPAIEDLLPTGPWTFLVSTRNGLSAYLGSKGWSHFPPPGEPAVACADWHSSLARHGRRFWWQPAPGRLVQVARDGSLVADREITGLAPDDPQAADAGLLRLLGADPGGRLWFTVTIPAAPAPPAPAPPAQGEPAPEAPVPAGGNVPPPAPDRLYRWNPDRETLERLTWGEALAGMARPGDVSGSLPPLYPASGAFLLEGGRTAWWVPLEALPFRPCGAQAR